MAGTLGRLGKRAEFLAAASRGKKWVTPGMIVQVLPRPDLSGHAYRFGLTASRKVGGAVQRNRARRRLRAIAEATLRAPLGLFPADIVLIARPATLSRDFPALTADFKLALERLSRLFGKEGEG